MPHPDVAAPSELSHLQEQAGDTVRPLPLVAALPLMAGLSAGLWLGVSRLVSAVLESWP